MHAEIRVLQKDNFHFNSMPPLLRHYKIPARIMMSVFCDTSFFPVSLQRTLKVQWWQHLFVVKSTCTLAGGGAYFHDTLSLCYEGREVAEFSQQTCHHTCGYTRFNSLKNFISGCRWKAKRTCWSHLRCHTSIMCLIWAISLVACWVRMFSQGDFSLISFLPF